ncbi:MAG: MtaA/CmuA family methyltransferase [Chloroflexi bacterium]|nr:MtaA/CmuA family methyltransferase [Chloroflexota bacterium]
MPTVIPAFAGMTVGRFAESELVRVSLQVTLEVRGVLQTEAGERKRRVTSAMARTGRGGRVPVICASQSATRDQMRRVGVHWPEAHTDARQMADLASAAHSVLGLDSVRVPFCQTVEAEALGCQIKSGGLDHVPGIATHVARVGEALDVPDDLLGRGRVPVLLEAVRLLKQSWGDEVAIIGGVTGPFTLAGLLLGTRTMLTQTMKNPQALVPILETCLRVGVLVAGALAEAGADIICVEDMAASAELISPAIYVNLAYPYQRRLFASVKLPSILHICGDVSSTVEQMASTGATALSYEGQIHSRVAEARVRDRVVLITGPDPAITLATGVAADVERQCLEFLAQGVDILAPGCAIASSTPTENLRAMVSAADRYGHSGGSVL